VNRWAFASITVIVLGVVAGFAIYTFGWRDNGGTASVSRDVERTLAQAYIEDALSNAGICDEETCEVEVVDSIGKGLWRFDVVRGTDTRCVLVDVAKVRAGSGSAAELIGPSDCASLPAEAVEGR